MTAEISNAECALWVACQYIKDITGDCPSEAENDCPKGGDDECENYTACWIAHFKEMVE